MSLSVGSWAFGLEEIPIEYTGDGKDLSPPLEWQQGPEGTKSYALIMDDPDAPRGTWVHWVAWNIRDTKLAQNLYKQPFAESAFGPMCQGRNSWGRIGYNGPCPPSGTHRYFFKIYALDTDLNLPSDATKKDLLRAMEGHVLDLGELMVTYSHARAVEASRRAEENLRNGEATRPGPVAESAAVPARP